MDPKVPVHIFYLQRVRLKRKKKKGEGGEKRGRENVK